MTLTLILSIKTFHQKEKHETGWQHQCEVEQSGENDAFL